MVTARVPVQREDLDTPPAYDGLDWERDFDAYVRVNVENAKRLAETRLDLGLDDDYLPSYHPYFGISIHCAFFGGAVHFGGGTSYMEPVIERAAEWERLRADPENVWLRRLTRGLAYCRDHGDGVLLAGYRGGNGPMDMANGVMGNALFTELYDDPENMRRVLDVCTDGIRLTFGLQQAHNTPVMGGHIAAGVWLPDPMIGHLSVDASCLTGPATYDEFEKPCLERLAGDVGAYFMHVHMLGRAVYRSLCATQGLAILAPVDDPNQPSILDALDEVLESIGSTAFTIEVPIARFDEVLPKLRGRRVFIAFQAPDHVEAARALERIDHYLPLQRS